MVGGNVAAVLHVWLTVFGWAAGIVPCPPTGDWITSMMSFLISGDLWHLTGKKRLIILREAYNAFIPLCFNKSDSRVSLGQAFSAAIDNTASGKTPIAGLFDWMKASRWKWASRLVSLREWERWTVAFAGCARQSCYFLSKRKQEKQA